MLSPNQGRALSALSNAATKQEDPYLGRLYLGTQCGDFLFDLGLHLLYLELLTAALFAHSALFQVEIQTHASLRPCYLLAQPLLELLDVRHEPVILSLEHREIVLLSQLELGLELGEVDLLCVVML